ncbi:hypothetical protein BpHYR1_034749 [Brachionus plicatilis]|uniref:Uncharacterized protein n=1 Tax=Brachionus plicatilis TaxID=10195 RepID=A0A3M7RSV9_BRAPC|nr:hypothetical protein BpHYR1_034749 [Brachionus plicatilis]
MVGQRELLLDISKKFVVKKNGAENDDQLPSITLSIVNILYIIFKSKIVFSKWIIFKGLKLKKIKSPLNLKEIPNWLNLPNALTVVEDLKINDD